MKTLYLDVEFNTDEHYDWSLVPAGTKCSYEKFEWHGCEETYTTGKLKDDISWIVDEYKKVIERFIDNVTGAEADIVQDVLNDVLNKNWNESFDVRNYDGHGNIHVKFYIDNHFEKQPFTLYVTPEQKGVLNAMLYKVDDFRNKKDEEIKDGVTDIIVFLCKRYLNDEYEYDKQDLLDALDELTDGSFDGAAYDTIKEFIEHYFDEYTFKKGDDDM